MRKTEEKEYCKGYLFNITTGKMEFGAVPSAVKVDCPFTANNRKRAEGITKRSLLARTKKRLRTFVRNGGVKAARALVAAAAMQAPLSKDAYRFVRTGRV